MQHDQVFLGSERDLEAAAIASWVLPHEIKRGENTLPPVRPFLLGQESKKKSLSANKRRKTKSSFPLALPR